MEILGSSEKDLARTTLLTRGASPLYCLGCSCGLPGLYVVFGSITPAFSISSATHPDVTLLLFGMYSFLLAEVLLFPFA
jgi:hypothetical protein